MPFYTNYFDFNLCLSLLNVNSLFDGYVTRSHTEMADVVPDIVFLEYDKHLQRGTKWLFSSGLTGTQLYPQPYFPMPHIFTVSTNDRAPANILRTIRVSLLKALVQGGCCIGDFGVWRPIFILRRKAVGANHHYSLLTELWGALKSPFWTSTIPLLVRRPARY